ncbi:YfcL family protein [Shewanella sp.]|uniref:YfcL family protein n=1 Tax=Shewanella sp. TaxID=50422 RepID=UPI001EC6CB83|nr:YfcL family protein [Shewanella sp.]NRB22375.1 YfcL family protein [Shewanella sp.]
MLEQYETSLYEWIDDIVAKGDEDALFASGYLQGHFAVALSQLEAETVQGIDALDEKMHVCLELAKQELDDTDYALVASAWQQLNERLCA